MLSSRPFQCPPALLARAEGGPPLATAVAGATSAVALESARQAHGRGLIEPILVGERALVERAAGEIGWDISRFRVVDAAGEAEAARAAVALARNGEAALLMKGHVHTDALMRAVLDKALGLRAGRRMTHVFHMSVPDSDRVLLISDAAVNVAPDLATKLDIVRNAVDLAPAIGIERPKVALLSGTEEPTASMPSSMEAREVADRLAPELGSRCDIHGPLAFDNAVSPEAARLKGIDHPVAGRADILVVPNIETGNALFKMMVYFMGATAAGIVLGASVPIVLTSRADPPEARLAATALAGLMARRSAPKATEPAISLAS